MSHADNATHGSKGISAIKPANPTQADKNWDLLKENNRRSREDDLPPMTKAEADEFLQPRTTHANTLAFGDDPAAPLDQPCTAVDFAGGLQANE